MLGFLAIDQVLVGQTLINHAVNRHVDEAQGANLRSVVAE
jgi:hypothetical protein